jgi:signal transduction histidine kinase
MNAASPRVDYDRLLYASIVALAVGVIPIVALSDWLRFDRVAVARLALCAGFFCAALAAYFLTQTGRKQAAATLLVASVWMGATLFVFYTGLGLHSSVVYLYLPAVLYTSLLCGVRVAAVQAVLTIAAVAAMVWAENTGRIPGVRAFAERTTAFNFALGVSVSLIGSLVIAVAYQRAVRDAVLALEDSRRQIAEARDAVLEANRGLEARVAERTRELAEKLEELESFNHSVAHDLRAPLRTINAYASKLRTSAGMGAGDRQMLERIAAETLHMDKLLIALLDLAQLGRHQVVPRRVDLSAIARDIAEQLAQQPGGAVDFRVEPGLAAEGDPDLLRVLLRNLLDNAVKFSRGRPGALVEFGAEPTGGNGHAAFFVSDNGIGFEQSHARQLFRPFHRLHAAEGFPGIGIGLASAQRIVRLHRGSIWCASMPGRGATFYFTLGGAPLASPPS